MAIYNVHSKPIANDKACPPSVYLACLATFTIMISFFISWILGEKFDLSFDENTGMLGFFGSWNAFKYGFLGLAVMAGYVYHYFTMRAHQHIGSMFINVCYNFTPFLSQVTAYMIGAQAGFPGGMTAFGGAILFVGCTLLAMNYQDQQEMAHIPTVALKDVNVAAPAEEEAKYETPLKQ